MIAICIHGGAGDRQPSGEDTQLLDAMQSALEAGWQVLASGGSALDAVQRAIEVLEDAPLLNAGTGAALTRDGTIELDAALMDGATEQAGAVVGVRRLRHPIAAARVVMEHSPHVIIAGESAEKLAAAYGCDIVDPEELITDRARAALERYLAREQRVELGTVGAVALDASGRLAAGNSTGGITGKLPGRVGDTPIIGGGTYANRRVAVACTGYGEYFIRVGAALRVALLHEVASLELSTACQKVLEHISALGGRGGIIALSTSGEIAMHCTTSSMARAWRRDDGYEGVALWATETAP